MVYMRTCCCCFNTKNGSIASGVYTMIGKLISIVVLIIVLASSKALKDANVQFGLSKDNIGVFRGVLIFGLVQCLIFVGFCALLIYGAHKDRPGFLIPWTVIMSIEVAINIIGLIACIIVAAVSKHTNVAMVVCTVLFMAMHIAFTIYMILCVESQRKLLLQGSSSPPAYAAKM